MAKTKKSNGSQAGTNPKQGKQQAPRGSVGRTVEERVEMRPEDINIDPAFAHYFDPVTNEERKVLEEELVEDGGCRDDLIVWKEQNILVDGHTS